MTKRILAPCDFLATTSIHFLQSGFSEQSNQHDTRQTITKRRQCLSDGPNVTDLRAAVCEGQAWHAAEQRGPRGWSPIKTGKQARRPWHVAPLLSRHSHMKNSPAPLAAAAAAAGLLSPSLPACVHQNVLICPFPFMYQRLWTMVVCFLPPCVPTFFHSWAFLSVGRILTLLSCPFSSPLTSVIWLYFTGNITLPP